MERIKQVANKELSKKLEELGVKIDTIFYHDYLPGGADGIHTEQEFKLLNGDLSDHAIPAPTSSELGEIAKRVADYNTIENYIKEDKVINYIGLTNPTFWAEFIIYLIEQGLVKVEDINY